MLFNGKIMFIFGVSCGIGFVIVKWVVCDGVNIVLIVKIVELYLKLLGMVFMVVKEFEEVGG